ncbi:hypothetical protein PFISCL1PPCAC_18622, partial [Pristionchus fissidentatus]
VECKEQLEHGVRTGEGVSDAYLCEKTTDSAVCDKNHSIVELQNLPAAKHTMKLREELQQRGVRCPECFYLRGGRLEQVRKYHRDLIYVCTEFVCSELGRIHERSVYNITDDSRTVCTQGYLPVRLLRLCVFCIGKHMGYHDIKKITEISNLERTLSVAADLNRERPIILQHRAPFHLSMVSLEWIDKLLNVYFSCCHGDVVYRVGESYVPCILDCSHVVCSNCQDIAKSTGECPVCHISIAGSKQHRRAVADLQFITNRDTRQYRRCHACSKLHPTDFMRGKECAFCEARLHHPSNK